MLGLFDDFLGKRARRRLAHVTAEFFHEWTDRWRRQRLIFESRSWRSGRPGGNKRGCESQSRKLEQAPARKRRARVGVLLLDPLVKCHLWFSLQTNPIQRVNSRVLWLPPLLGKRFHDAIEFVLCFKADTRKLRQTDVAVFDGDRVRKSSERLANTCIGFITTEAKPGRDVERHLMPTVRNAASGRPAVFPQHFENTQVFHQAVTKRAI